MPLIKNHLSIELCLDECVYALRCKALGLANQDIVPVKKAHKRRVTVNTSNPSLNGDAARGTSSVLHSPAERILNEQRMRYKSAESVTIAIENGDFVEPFRSA